MFTLTKLQTRMYPLVNKLIKGYIMATTTTGRLLRIREVETRTTLSHSTIYRKMREGSFPESLKIGARAVRWRESEIEAWLEACPRGTGDTPP